MTDIKYRGAETINYKLADFSELKYIKIIYKNKDGETYEYKTETNFLSDSYMSLYIKRTSKNEDTNEEQNDEQNEEVKENNASESVTNYLNKLAEIRLIKEKAETTGNYKEYYEKLAEFSVSKSNEETTQKENLKDEKSEIKQAENNKENKEEIGENEENQESKEFDIECPQKIILKFVIDELLYIAEAELIETIVKKTRVYFKIKAPEILKFEQHRRFYRITLKRVCLLIATNKKGYSDVFISKSINLSAGGVLINKLETLTEDNKYVSISPEKYSKFNLVILLEMDKVLKLSAKYIRQEKGENSWKYGFEFINVSKEKTDEISKYVIGKQIDELRAEFDMKNKNFHTKYKG